jgi:hypothetical protein
MSGETAAISQGEAKKYGTPVVTARTDGDVRLRNAGPSMRLMTSGG